MMRRCVNEAMVCARSRIAFGKTIIEYPLLRRQLLKIAVPVEQSLSMFLFAASADGSRQCRLEGRSRASCEF